MLALFMPVQIGIFRGRKVTLITLVANAGVDRLLMTLQGVLSIKGLATRVTRVHFPLVFLSVHTQRRQTAHLIPANVARVFDALVNGFPEAETFELQS